MPRVFVGNFDFEHELITGPRQLSREARSLAADLVSVWVAVADQDDVIWSPTGVPAFDFHDLVQTCPKLPRFISREQDLPRGTDWELVPWGWTSHLISWGQRHKWSCPAPPIDVVRKVNSRIFRAALEHEFDIQPGGLCEVRTLKDLLACISNHGETGKKWVVKANYGMSGRERIFGSGPQLEEHALNWARRRLDQSEALVFEPWLDRIAEAGIQWQIPPAGDPVLMGITPLMTDNVGTYRGSRTARRPGELEDWQPALEPTRRVALRLQESGYWGPLGVDAMHYRTDDGETRLRPLQDLNARWTMGRMALGLRRFVPVGHSADWLHDKELVSQAIDVNPRASVIQTTAGSWLVIQ